MTFYGNGWLDESGVIGLGSPLARLVEVHAEISSTQERGRLLALDGAGHGTLVVSRVQLGGRGRLGRSWGSPAGGLWMSVVIRDGISARVAPRTTMTAAVAVAKSLHGLGVDARIKWPNDLLVGGRKICGILAESSMRIARGGVPAELDFVVLGIGLNANLDPSDLDVLPGEATTVREQLGRDVPLIDILEAVLSGLSAELSRMHDFDRILEEWREMNCTLGRRVRVTRSGETIEGFAVDVTPEGALILDSDGDRVELFEGDVRGVRPESHRGQDTSRRTV